VEQAMTRLESLLAVSPDLNAYEVLAQMSEKDVNQIPVVEEGQLVGIIARDSILRFIQARSDLGV
jgi:CBS domain-containing protein